MRRIILLLPLTVIGVLLLVSGTVVAQEQSLPDLTVEKSGPAVVTEGEFAIYTIVVTNEGPGNAIIPPGTGDTQTSPTLWLDVARYSHHTVLGSGCGISGSGYSLSGVGGHNRSTCAAVRNQNQEDVITPGETKMGQGFFPTANPGIIRDCATVDPYNVVEESDETNNTQCLLTKVRPEKAR